MAWHSGKPADGDFLSVSVQHIRENFAELEPLQPHVAEIVDLTALQPHVTELVDLTALQPHVAALLDSRIVEMGSNANGEYVRWENGLQICWADRSVINWPAQTTANEGSYYASDFTWTFPASFIDTNIVITASPGYVGTASTWGATTIYHTSITTTSVILRLWTTHSRPSTSNGVAVAIGGWK